MAKTYGEKPIIFAFEENGEQYMIGSEVIDHFSDYDFTYIDTLGGQLPPPVQRSSLQNVSRTSQKKSDK